MAPMMVKKRRERNKSGEMLKDLRDIQRKDEFIMSHGILIDINNRCDE